MDWRENCVVIIPCLNEAAHLASVIEFVRVHLPHVICVDDGSTDGTAAIAKAAGATVIRHTQSLGKGTALASGWRLARERGFLWALSMDGDGQHAPDDVPAFLRAAETTHAPLIIGNRMADPRGMPLLRRFVNRWMSRELSRAAGRDLPDTQCGFRLMRLDAWSKLPVRAAHFEIESDLTLAFARAGHDIGFVPVRVIYLQERSKIRPLRDTWRWFRWWRQAKLQSESADVQVSVPLATPVESEISA